MKTEMPAASGYGLLSTCRSELMGVAMLWVMVFHAYSLNLGWGVLNAIKQVGFGGVDVFILLSAMGIYVSLSKTDGRVSFGAYMLRRLKRILPAYWLVVGAYSLWLRWLGRTRLLTGLWSLSTLHYWFQIPGSFNWYVPALLAFYLIAPWYIRLFRACRWKEWLTAAMFAVSYGLYRLSILAGVDHIRDFLYRIPAFALGVLMGYYLVTKQPLTRRHGAVWCGAAALGVLAAVLVKRGVFYIATCYWIALLLVPGCLLAAWLLERVRNGLAGRFLRLLGTCSLEIYLLNVIVTREALFLAPHLGLGTNPWVIYGVLDAVNILLGVLLHKALERASAAIAARTAA